MKIINNYKDKKIYDNYKIYFADIKTVINKITKIHDVTCVVLLKDYDDYVVFNNIPDFIAHITNKSRYSIIYFHNLGRFDSMFILNYLAKTSTLKDTNNIKVIERNNVIYEISFLREKIIIRDSLLVIPLSLSSLGKTFCKKYFKTDFDYDEIINKPKKEVVELCIQDCKVLKEGYDSFSEIVLNLFNMKLYNQLTLPSFSFNLFKKKYYFPELNPISKNPYEEDLFIRESYKGCIAEVYKPHLINGYCYDANSLYPTVMFNEKFPIGKGKFVDGNKILLDDFIGFIKCEIETDKNIDFLTFRHPKKGLITPKGKWIDTYYVDEIKMAIKLGYNVKFIKGFKYEKSDYLFKNFVKDLYDIRVNSKSKEINQIAKLILNSFYGRFGMKIFVESMKFINYSELNEMKKKYLINHIEHLGNGMYIISGIKKSLNKSDLYKNSIDTETAVQIASCVTAYARIFMYKFKNIVGNPCFYTDTDSIFVEREIDPKYLGSELGKFKLEYFVKEGIFIAPKVYYIEKGDGTKKIVIKGVKNEEHDDEKLLSLFRDRIYKKSDEKFEFLRESKFKRDFKNLNIKYEEMNIGLDFPFNKRRRIYKEGIWIGTKPISIKSL